jgi:hypothetical protein
MTAVVGLLSVTVGRELRVRTDVQEWIRDPGASLDSIDKRDRPDRFTDLVQHVWSAIA